jgi:predicted ATP-grasp superfamily ATP-dependent carboligase
MKKATLVLGAAPRVVVPIARSLRRIGVPCIVGIFSEKNSSLGSNAVRRVARFPHPANGAAFLKALTTLIDEENIDTIFPGSDLAMSAIGDHYERLSGLVYTGCPAPGVVDAAHQKLRTFEAASQCGIEVPELYVAPTLADLDALCAEIHFPVIIKRRSAAVPGGFKVRHYFSYEALRAEYLSSASFGSQTILQRYEHGEGVGLALIMRGGSVLAPFQYRSLKELPTTGGVSCLVEAEELDAELLDRTASLLRTMRWEGVAMVEYIRDPRTRHCRLLEVNGRYWGCLALAIQSGMDYPKYECRIAHGVEPEINPKYRVGTRSRWTGGMLRRLGGLGGDAHRRLVGTSRLQEIFITTSAFLPPVRSALWSWRDPIPSIWDGLAAWEGLLSDICEAVPRYFQRGFGAAVAARATSWGVRH